MGQHRLNGFAMMTIKREISKKIDFTEVIDQCAVCRAKRQQL